MADAVDRSTDLSQPLDRLGPDETLKHDSDQLRGSIARSLVDEVSWGVTPGDAKLLKFQGIYQQDNRDIRDERRRQKLEPALQFMVRVRLPGGICTPQQWLKIDALAREIGGGTLRMTTRQTFQFHWVLRHHLVSLIRGLHEVGLDTIAACGDDSRGVMSAVNPDLSAVHAELAALAESQGAPLLFEAAVMGGTPAVKMLREAMVGDDVVSVAGILNGTCNFILSEMEKTGRSFADVLREAQGLGYAEADPTTDVGGFDAGHKISILAALAFGCAPNFEAAEMQIFWLWAPLGWIGVALTIWCALFFRDPVRTTPVREGLVVAPADGRVSMVQPVVPPAELGLGDKPLMRISIFMSVFNCHVNRSPVAGRIERIAYRPGKFINAELDKASEDNERNSLVISTPAGRIGVIQIAGLVARRIVSFVREGESLAAGQRFGLIRFGARLDVFLPDGAKPLVAVGQTAVAGETVLADFQIGDGGRVYRTD